MLIRSSVNKGSLKKANRVLVNCRAHLFNRNLPWLIARLDASSALRARQLADFLRYLQSNSYLSAGPMSMYLRELYLEKKGYSKRYIIRNKKVKVKMRPHFRFVAKLSKNE